MKKNVNLRSVDSTESQNAQTINVVALGNIIQSEQTCGMPIIEVLLNGECHGYLSPFRMYSFQVSMTSNGQWDMGSSPVLGLRNILEASIPGTRGPGYQSNLDWNGEAQACLLKGLALQALVEYAHGDAVLKLGEHSFEKDSINCTNRYYHDRLEKYISVVVDYLKGGEV